MTSKIFAVVVATICILYIFSNSAKTAVESSNQSGRLLLFITDIFDSLFGIKLSQDGIIVYIIRKLAHASEFFALGSVLYYARFVFTKDVTKKAVYPIFIGVLTALTDETIQYFFEGRSAEVKDVWIDLFGFICAYLLFNIIFVLIKKSRTKVRDKKL